MREIAVISGRNTSGKDSLLVSFFSLAGQSVLVDCSLEFSGLRKVLGTGSVKVKQLPFFRGFSFDADRCSHCRKCLDICYQHAIGYDHDRIRYYEYRCSHCGSCIRWCPLMVLGFENQSDISLSITETPLGPLLFSQSLCEPGLQGELIRALRDKAAGFCKDRKLGTLLINGSRGVNASSCCALVGVDVILIVTSPSIWAEEDLVSDIRLSRHSGIEPFIILNKAGMDTDFDDKVEALCESNRLSVFGRIPVEESFRHALIRGTSLVEYAPGSEAAASIRSIWHRMNDSISQVRP
ncbi:MAG: hypothetical protein NTU44_17940 [Bacteroidetes bacterium]|nr:hypothetical protein [Bacteroidota bacterium]